MSEIDPSVTVNSESGGDARPQADSHTIGPAGSLTGRQLGRYLVGRPLGSGGAATVYQAYDQVRGRSVALKVLTAGADPIARDRFRQEARTAAALQHPHIVQTLQVGSDPGDGVAYIAMELIEGESLARLLERRYQLSPAESCNLLDPIARALDYAHRQGIVHRDVKPSNILLRPVSPGAPGSVQLEALDHPVTPLLSDFGIARALDMPELTNLGRTVGTPAYMAPEQCAGSREITPGADIYSLGAVLYRCLVGRPPFGGSTTQILHAHVYAPLAVPDDVLTVLPPAVVEILRRSLAKDPAERYATAREMAAALAAVAGRSLPEEAAEGEPESATLTLASLPAAPAPRITETVIVPAGPGPGRTELEPSPVRPSMVQRLALPPEGASSRTGMLRIAAGALGGLAVFALMAILWFAAQSFPRERLFAQPTPLVTVAGVAMAADEPPVLAAPTAATPAVPTVTPEPPTPEPALTLEATNQAMPIAMTPTPEPTATPTVPTVTPEPPTSEPPPTQAPPPAETAPPRSPEPPEQPTDPPDGSDKKALPPDGAILPFPTEQPIVACQYVMAGEFFHILNASDAISQELGCPKDVPQEVSFVLQPFQNGFALARLDQPTVYIRFASNNEWEQRIHSWQPGMPERSEDPELQPPGPGLFQPERGIGQIWAQNLSIRQALGWATAPETVTSGVLQTFDGGLLIFDQSTGQVYIFLKSQLRL